mmetsp:Transcript_24030/g.35606  ORF Transcript_24030/g.35606 Transcript_24030/m.35606 type:complete len:196 (-) Transcript_24030:255-842(-)
MSPSTDGETKGSLRLAVFDLDYTIWMPEMYQLHGPPKKITCPETSKPIVVDSSRSPQEITIFDGACHALCHIDQLNEAYGMDIEVAVASRTDEPSWAHSCMDWLRLRNGKSLKESIHYVEIDFGDKQLHFRNLKKQTGLSYKDMVFFDNEMRNIQSVSQLGVKCVYTPDGMMKEHWFEALEMFGLDHLKIEEDEE